MAIGGHSSDAETAAVSSAAEDTAARRRAEDALRDSEARQAFLVRLGDALRPLVDPDEIQARATRMLGEFLRVNRVTYAEIEGPDAVIRQAYVNGVDALPRRFRYADYGKRLLEDAARHDVIAVANVETDDRLTDDERAAHRALHVAAFTRVMLIKDARWVAAFGTDSDTPRRWTTEELGLIREVAERMWEAVDRANAEAALRNSEARLRLIVESASDYAILTMDPQGLIESWSPGAEAVFGWNAAETIGQPVAMTFLPEDRAARVPEKELGLAAADGVAPDIRWHLRKDGSRVFIDGTTRALRDEAQGLRGFLKVGQDVTQRRELDEALRTNEARYRALVDNVRDYAIFLLDANGTITEWTLGAERMKGYTAEEVVGQHLSLLYTPEDIGAGVVERELAEAAATGRAEREAWRMRKGGERFWANEIVTAVRDVQGRLVGFTKIARDLTERRRAEEAATRARAAVERDALRRQLAAAEEAERRRIARELHDQLGQHLTAFSLKLVEIRGLLDGREAAVTRLAQLEDLAALMTRDARYLALELRPPELDDVGLESALQSYIEQWRVRYVIEAELAVTGSDGADSVPSEAGTAIYRIVQEALTNVAKHAEARQVTVHLDKAEGEARLIVEDDGRGFDPEATAKRAKGEHRLGLAGMRERATLVGGTLEVESAARGGTTIYVRIPLREPATQSEGERFP